MAVKQLGSSDPSASKAQATYEPSAPDNALPKKDGSKMIGISPDQDWVGDSLRKLYTDTINEGIPNDLLTLLDHIGDAKSAQFGDAEKAKGGGQ